MKLALIVVAIAGIAVAQDPRTTMVAMRDGVRLATDVYGADGNIRKPVLLTRTPYDKKGQRQLAEKYVHAGYAVVIQDCRGRYASEGDYTPYQNDKLDSFDTLQWIHAQPWSN